MNTNIEYLSYSEIEALDYFQLSSMRYDDKNVGIKKVDGNTWENGC